MCKKLFRKLFVFNEAKYGDVGSRIEKLQQLLRKSGSNIAVTGEFSVGMVSAVRSFQKKNGLTVNGIIDHETYKKLKENDR